MLVQTHLQTNHNMQYTQILRDSRKIGDGTGITARFP